MNDPNGLVYFNGVYHLYFQYNPEGNDWGNMSWGHASSSDLVHWTEHPVAILCDDNEAIYSGSVVVDHHNSSGFGEYDITPFVAIYTSAFVDGRQAQSLAYSLDQGTSWTKYSGNPVLDRNSTAFRDPKVFWFQADQGQGYWVLVAVEAVGKKVVLYRSVDLRDWVHLSDFGSTDEDGGLWECPDLFRVPVDDAAAEAKWVLVVSRDPGRSTQGSFAQYYIGDFDGTNFTSANDGVPRRLDWGRDYYAAVSFDNVPHGRRILLGWMSNWNYAAAVPTAPWRGTMSLPREISLRDVGGEIALIQRPAAGIDALRVRAENHSIRPFTVEGSRPIEGSPMYRLDVSFEPVDARTIGLDLLVGDNHATRVRYDTKTGLLSLDRRRSGTIDFESSFASIETVPIRLIDGALRLEVYVDRGSVEVFAQDGEVSITDQVFAPEWCTGLSIVSSGGATRVQHLNLETFPDARAAAKDPDGIAMTSGVA
jgi:fructan beta-fructosidase